MTVPKLRFPEFRDGPAWLALKFADLYALKRSNTLSRDKLNYETGTIRNIHYGDIHTRFKPLFRVGNESVPFVNPDAAPSGFADFCDEGDIVLADASEDLDDVGKAIEVVSLDGERVIAGTHTILATRRGSVPVVGFGGQLFQSAAVRAGIKKEAQGAKVYGISANRISAIQIPVPPTEAEQQKIADCLGSLDDLIAAEDRQLKALRQHRRGLSQQLFPDPGEGVPRLRFPIFEGAPRWKKRELRSICERIMDGTHFSPKSKDGPRPYLTSRNIRQGWLDTTTASCISEEEHREIFARCPVQQHDVLLTKDGANTGNCAINSLDYEFSLLSSVAVLRGNVSEVTQQFLFQSLMSDRHQTMIRNSMSGQAITRVTLEKLGSYEIALPTIPEQRHIAECLSSLDGQIAAQARRIDTLRQHKQGLLQQLFPSLEEVSQ